MSKEKRKKKNTKSTNDDKKNKLDALFTFESPKLKYMYQISEYKQIHQHLKNSYKSKQDETKLTETAVCQI